MYEFVSSGCNAVNSGFGGADSDCAATLCQRFAFL